MIYDGVRDGLSMSFSLMGRMDVRERRYYKINLGLIKSQSQ